MRKRGEAKWYEMVLSFSPLLTDVTMVGEIAFYFFHGRSKTTRQKGNFADNDNSARLILRNLIILNRQGEAFKVPSRLSTNEDDEFMLMRICVLYL